VWKQASLENPQYEKTWKTTQIKHTHKKVLLENKYNRLLCRCT